MVRVKEVAARQIPFPAFLGCADSRVPIAIVFDPEFGDVFVSHIAGNAATNENLGSHEFGTSVLGAKVLYLLGHTSWGAETTALKRRRIAGTHQPIVPAFASRREAVVRRLDDRGARERAQSGPDVGVSRQSTRGLGRQLQPMRVQDRRMPTSIFALDQSFFSRLPHQEGESPQAAR